MERPLVVLNLLVVVFFPLLPLSSPDYGSYYADGPSYNRTGLDA